MAYSLEQISMIAMEDWDGLAYAKRRAEYYYNTRNSLTAFEKALIACSNQCLKNPEGISTTLRHFMAEVEHLRKDETLQTRLMLMPCIEIAGVSIK